MATRQAVQFQDDVKPDASVEKSFKRAHRALAKIPKKSKIQLSSSEKLELYALYHQGLEGKCTAPEPKGVTELVERAKWEAWRKLRSMDRSDAMERYAAMIRKIATKYQDDPDAVQMLRIMDSTESRLEGLSRDSVLSMSDIPITQVDKENAAPPPAMKERASSSMRKAAKEVTRKEAEVIAPSETSAKPSVSSAPALAPAVAKAQKPKKQVVVTTEAPATVVAAALKPEPVAATPSVQIPAAVAAQVAVAAQAKAATEAPAPVLVSPLAAQQLTELDNMLKEIEEKVEEEIVALPEIAPVTKEPTAPSATTRALTIAGNLASASITVGALYVIGGWLRLYRR